MTKFTEAEEKEMRRQLYELQSDYNENPKFVCDSCETPLVVNTSCCDQMAESMYIDWKDNGYVTHVVAICENSHAHQENCWTWDDNGGIDYNCNLDEGSDDPKGYDNKVCHNGYEWVDIWDKRFSKNPEDKTLFPDTGIKLVKESN